MIEKKTINWTYVIVFYLIACILSVPFNSFYFLADYNKITQGTLFYDKGFLPAGIGTLIAATIAFYIDKDTPKIIHFWGNHKYRNLVITLVPLVVFTLTGLPNMLEMNPHIYAFLMASIFLIYSLCEEIFWRGYMINALMPLGKMLNYLVLGILWWAWHFPFTAVFGDAFLGFISFLGMVIISSFLIGKFVDESRSYLTAAGLHSLAVIVSGQMNTSVLYTIGFIIVIWLSIGKWWKIDETILTKEI